MIYEFLFILGNVINADKKLDKMAKIQDEKIDMVFYVFVVLLYCRSYGNKIC